MPIETIHADDFGTPETPHRRIRWAPESADLHVNLVDLRGGEEIGAHVNTALDVLLTCLGGAGTLFVDDEPVPLQAGTIALIPKGARREVLAGEGGVRYTTCHIRRGGLMPTVGGRPPAH